VGKACHEAGMQPIKLKTSVKTRFASKVIIFQEILEYVNVINICYTRQSSALQAKVPNGLTWAIARIITETLNPIVHQCLLNQRRRYELLSNALFVVLAIMMKIMKREYACQVVVVPPLQCGEIDQEIEIMYGKMVVEIINVLHPFLGFAKSFFRDKVHNMVALMLDPHFKGMDCIMDYNSRDQVATLVQHYDNLIVLPILKVIMGFLNPSQTTSLDPSPLE
jgi:hypothetical protein